MLIDELAFITWNSGGLQAVDLSHPCRADQGRPVLYMLEDRVRAQPNGIDFPEGNSNLGDALQ